MSEPLTKWRCDTCQGPITDVEKAVVVARCDEELRLSDFRLVHKSMDGRHCDPGDRGGYESSWELGDLLGEDGLASLLAFLSPGPLRGGNANRIVDVDEFVDLVRRLHTPYYEEARPRFTEPEVVNDLADTSEDWPYVPAVLKRIAAGEIGQR